MKRRTFMQVMAGLFGLGATSVEASWRPGSGESPVVPSHVDPGHIYRCENGHPICEAIDEINVGDIHWHLKIGKWRQPEPQLGDPLPVCADCGTKVVFWRKYGEINAL